MRQSILSVGFAFLFVVSLMAAPISTGPVGTASATHECSIGDAVLGGLTLFWVNADKCLTEHVDDHENQTSVDQYQQGLGIADQNDVFLTQQENFGQDTRGIMWSKAKMAVIDSMNDGNTSATTIARGNESAREYESFVQANLWKQYSASVTQLDYIYRVNSSMVIPGPSYVDSSWHVHGFADVAMETSNGSIVQMRAPILFSTGGTENQRTVHIPFWGHAPSGMSEMDRISNVTFRDDLNLTKSDLDGIDASGSADGHGLSIAPPTSDYSEEHILNNSRYEEADERISAQSQAVQDGMTAYVNGVYDAYQAGDLSTEDLIDPQTLAANAATDYESTGYYAHAAAELAALGYAGNLNASHTISINGTEGNWTGTVYTSTDELANDSLETGATYDPANYNGTFYIAYQDGDAGGIKLIEDEFTILETVNTQTGEEMTNTTVVKKVYQTADADRLQEELDALRELRESYELAVEAGGGGGGIDFDFGGTELGFMAALGAVVVLMIARG